MDGNSKKNPSASEQLSKEGCQSGVSTATLGLSEDMLAITNSSSTQPICESDEDEPPPDPENVTTLTKRLFTDVTYFWRSFVLILTPILLAPCLISSDSTYRCAFCVSLMAVYWVCEVIPLPVTALLPVVLFPISGILDATTVAKEFLNDTNFLFIGGLIMAVAVEKCHLHERVALRVVTLVGSQPRWIMFGFMSVTALLSMFVSNTATTAMMVPIAQSVSDQLLKSYRARRSRRSTIEKRPDNEDILVHRIEIVQDLPSTKEETDMAKGLIICICFAANIGGTATLTGTPPNLVMVGQIATLFPDVDTDLNYLTWIGFAFPLMVLCLFACYLILLGFFLRHSPPADEEAANVMRRRYDKLPPMSFAEKSVLCCFILLILLWMGRDPQVVPGFGDFFPRGHYTDATSAMLISVVLFALPDEMPDFICISKRDRILTPKRRGALMDWKTIQAQFPWSVVLLLGGGFALAAGVKESGLSAAIGDLFAHLGELPTPLLQSIFIVAAMIVTNICSNTVTASIFLPLVSTLAQQTKVNPLAMMFPVTIACSFVFILPVGTPPNAIVFASGLLKVSDMILSGITISLISTCLIVGYMMTLANLVFPLNEFPQWAMLNTTANINE
uniref:Uncharacterized protein n=3 Tax=Parascaris univalens TaxID=6257 RepID=A0A914ZXV5_PARUN